MHRIITDFNTELLCIRLKVVGKKKRRNNDACAYLKMSSDKMGLSEIR